MPFINGRFYMNPAYGRSVEQARAAEIASSQHEPQPQDPNAHWVTMDGRHVLIHETQAGRVRYDYPQGEEEARLTNVTFNETSGLRANPKAKPGTPGSAEDLHNARVAIAEVAHTVLESDHPERVQASTELPADAVRDINAGNRDAILAHNDSLNATRAALDGSNTTAKATQYRINARDTQASINGKNVTLHFGPFQNVQGGTRVIIVAP